MMRVSAVLALILALASVGSANADYPDRPVRVVVPVAAGGGVDVMARLLAQKLSERLGQQFVVENRAGAAGVIGVKAVIASPADGTTLLYTPSSLSLTVAVHKTPPYDVAKDLTPIINVAVSPYALVVHPSLPVRESQRVHRLCQGQSGKLSYSSAGVGSASHLAGELLKTMAGIDMVHVPNKGMNPALIDLMGGQVQVLFASVPGMLSERSERLRPIAMAEQKALGAAAGPADHGRAGPEGFEVGNWAGLLAPGGPRSRDREEAPWRDHEHSCDRRREGRASRRSATTRSRARRRSSRAQVKNDVERWSEVVKRANVPMN